jgi:lysophospholipase L1-like esterase
MSVGDSIIANGGGIYNGGAPTNVYAPVSWIMWGHMLSGARFKDMGTVAVAGQTSGQVLSGQVPTVIAAKPDMCLVLAGTNDGTSYSTATTNLAAIYAALMNAGITPVACTLPPQTAYPNSKVEINAWIVRNAHALNIPLVDLHAPVVDPTTGLYLTGYSGDGTHPTEIAAKAMGQALANTMTNALGAAPPLLLFDTVNPLAVVGNPLFLTVHASTQPYPPWIISTGAGWTNTYTTPSWVKGQLFTLTRGTTDAFEGSDAGNDSTIVEGHKYVIGFKLTTSVKGVAGGAEYRMTRRSDSYQAFDLGSFTEDIPINSAVSIDWTCPVGKGGAYRPEIRATGAANAAVSVAQFSVLDLTALGLA